MDNQQPAVSPTPAGGPAGGQKNTAMAIVAYFIFFIPLLTDAKNDPFVKYHVKQGLGMLALWVLWNVVSWYIYFFGIEMLISLAIAVLWILGIVNAVQGKQAPVPLIGQIFEKFNF